VEVNNKSEINGLFGSDEPTKEEVEQEIKKLEEEVAAGKTAETEPSSAEYESADAIGDPVIGDDDPDLVEGSTTSFGFASEREIKKAKVNANPRLIAFKAVLKAAPVFLVIGIALGIVGCFWFFFGFNTGGKSVAASKAADEVAARLKNDGTFTDGETEIMFIDLYVRNKVEQYECLVFCVLEDGVKAHDERTYRVTIDKNDDKIRVFDPFDQAEYDRLNSSADGQDKIRAGQMDSDKREFERCVKEIEAEDSEWVQVSLKFVDFINIKTNMARNNK